LKEYVFSLVYVAIFIKQLSNSFSFKSLTSYGKNPIILTTKCTTDSFSGSYNAVQVSVCHMIKKYGYLYYLLKYGASHVGHATLSRFFGALLATAPIVMSTPQP
jgi:hypothetical protein